jgi:molybdopterin-guanine dinucleotide biosynthesis protein A
MPLLTVDCLQKLLQAQSTCHFENNPLPMFLNITPDVVSHTQRIYEQLANGKTCSVKHYLQGLQTVELPISPETAKALTNTNTPEEWRKVNEYTN